MKISIIIVILAIFFNSCSKKDKINHYLNEKVTELELIENCFFKYSYTYTYENDEDEKDTLNGKVYKYVLYSNVKPQKQDDGKFYPTTFFGTNKSKENIAYLENELDDRIITYRFVNDTLSSKFIYVYSIDKHNKQIPDFTSEKSILNYYKN
jgi:hypothetical protein